MPSKTALAAAKKAAKKPNTKVWKGVKAAPSKRRYTRKIPVAQVVDSLTARDNLLKEVRAAKPLWPADSISEHTERLQREGWSSIGLAEVKEEGKRIWEPRTKRDQGMYDQGYSTGYRNGKNAGNDEGYRKGKDDANAADAVKKARYEAVTRLISATGQALTAQSETLGNLARIIDEATRG